MVKLGQPNAKIICSNQCDGPVRLLICGPAPTSSMAASLLAQEESANAGRIPPAPVAARNAIVIQGARNGVKRFAAGKPQLDLLPDINMLDWQESVPAQT